MGLAGRSVVVVVVMLDGRAVVSEAEKARIEAMSCCLESGILWRRIEVA